MFRNLLILVGLSGFSVNAFALPHEFGERAMFGFVLSTESADDEDLLGMANLRCSGGLVELNRRPDDHAVLLTNGHCARKPHLKHREIMLPSPYKRSDIYVGVSDGQTKVTPRQVLYATMTGTDLALIELEETYAQLTSRGAKIFKIAPKPAEVGERVEIISGYWRELQHCRVERYVDQLLEENWVWDNAMALDLKCKIRDGYSGTPVLDTTRNFVLGIVNTAHGDGKPCTLDSPCESDRNGKRRVSRGRGYAQRVDMILGCITESGDVDLNIPGCALFHSN